MNHYNAWGGALATTLTLLQETSELQDGVQNCGIILSDIIMCYFDKITGLVLYFMLCT